VAGTVMVAAVALAAIWLLTRPRPAVVRTVLVRETTAGSADRTLLNASGYVTARRAATVSSKVTGKVTEVLVEEGMKVEAGQVLARLDASNVDKSLLLSKSQLESARMALGETKANVDKAQREFDRRIAAANAGSQLDLDRA